MLWFNRLYGPMHKIEDGASRLTENKHSIIILNIFDTVLKLYVWVMMAIKTLSM